MMLDRVAAGRAQLFYFMSFVRIIWFHSTKLLDTVPLGGDLDPTYINV